MGSLTAICRNLGKRSFTAPFLVTATCNNPTIGSYLWKNNIEKSCISQQIMVSTSFHFKLFKILRVKWYRRDWGHFFGKTNVVSLNLSFTFMANQHLYSCERFEPRSHFVSRLSMIVWVNVVLNRTVIVDRDWHFDNLCGSHLHSQSDLYQAS